MKEKIKELFKEYYNDETMPVVELEEKVLALFDVVGSALLYDLMKEQQEIVSSPIRFNGVHIEKIKQVFEKNGIKYDVGF